MSDAESFTFQPIGYLESPFKEKFGTPRQPTVAPSAVARLKIRRDLQPEFSLEGLAEFSHVWLIGVFHLNANVKFSAKVHPPRLEGKNIGLFATRSPHRPSPVSLSVARLVAVEGDTLVLSGIDLTDGTPILDVKPYVTEYDSVKGARSGWIENLTGTKLNVTFSEESLGDLQELVAISKPSSLTEEIARQKSLIREILENDPRPLRAKPGQSHSERSNEVFGFFVGEFNVRFTVADDAVLVVGIEERFQK